MRSLIEFDLTSIPKGAIINSAKLSLHSVNSSGNGKHRLDGGSNESTLSRITTAWQEDSVTWNNQPSISTTHQVTLAGSDSTIQDYFNIDVTGLITDMMTDSIGNNGFLLQLVTEQYYRTMMFASSDYADSTEHPKLEITYTPAVEPCVTLKPGASGKDAVVGSLVPNTNYGTHPEFTGLAGTSSGTPTNLRSLIEFDLSGIPAGATIDSAKLSLYSVNSSGNGMHRLDGGSNETTLSRVTSAWHEDSVTWNNQPGISITNQVTLAGSDSTIQDYLNIDVTALITDMTTDSIGNHGFLIQLVTEQYYRTMMFASSDYADPTVHPKLKVCYSVRTSVDVHKVIGFNLYPNPATGNVTIQLANDVSNVTVEVVNINGQVVLRKNNVNNNSSFSVAGYTAGLYFVKVYFNDSVKIEKLIVR